LRSSANTSWTLLESDDRKANYCGLISRLRSNDEADFYRRKKREKNPSRSA